MSEKYRELHADGEDVGDDGLLRVLMPSPPVTFEDGGYWCGEWVWLVRRAGARYMATIMDISEDGRQAWLDLHDRSAP